MSESILIIRAELEAIRARIDATLAQLPAAPAPAPNPLAEPRRMKLSVYASTRGYAPKTVARWCSLGRDPLPHVGQGRARRILVAQADAWIDGGGPARAADAARAAGREAAAQAAIQ